MLSQTFLFGLGVMLAGGFGAVARFALDSFLPVWRGVKVSTLLANLSGSFLVGVTTALVQHGLPGDFGIIFSVGFLGAFTTLSAASLQIAELVLKRDLGFALGLAMSHLVLNVVLTFAGFFFISRL